MKKRYIAWVMAFCLAGALAGAQPLAVQAEEIDTQEAETDEADEETDEPAAGNSTIFTLLDEPLSVQTYEGGGSLIEVYGGFTQVTGSDASETVLEDSRLILKRGSLIAVPSDLDYLDSRIDQIVVDTVSSSDTEVQYLSVLTEDHCVVDYYEALNWPEELSNAGIAEISNTLDTGDTVLIVRYLDNTVAAFNYLTGNLIYIDESEKTQLGFFEYLSNWFSETWNSLFGTQEEGYAELAQLEEELEETPVDGELLASLLGSDTTDSDGAGVSGQTGVTYGETIASGDGTAVSGDTTAAGETAEASDGVTATGETAEASDGVMAAGEIAEVSDGAAATEETAVASGETAVSEETAADPDDSMTKDGTAVSDGTAASEDGTAVPDETDVTADDSAEVVDDADTEEEEITAADDAEESDGNADASKEQDDAAASDETAESEEDTETAGEAGIEEDTETSAETGTEGDAAASDDTMSGGSGASGSSGGGDAIAAAASGTSGSSGADTAESASSEDESAAAEAETARAEVDGYIKVYDPETEIYALYTTEEYLSQSTAGGELLSETEKLEYLEAGGYAADTVNIAMSVEKKSGLRYVVLVCAGVIILLGVLFVVRLKLAGQTPKEKKTRNQQ